MGKTILFSPIGGTDPISTHNGMDGSMLHICRYYQPDKVYLYMSKEIFAIHQADDRYIDALNRLAMLQKRTMEYEIISRPDLEDVQEYDFFYDEFRDIFETIRDEMAENDRLLVNVSSGTPAMKSGLLILQTMGEFKSTPIQVITPERKMNTHIHDGYDKDVYWECNADNEIDENRCVEVTCPALSLLRDEAIIKKQILSYNYSAAYMMAKMLPATYTARYLSYLQLAEARNLLNFREADRVQKELSTNVFPVRESNYRGDFEYALNMDLKRRRGEYADFVRALTPLFGDLLERIIEKECRFRVDDYCYFKYGRKWDKYKLQGSKVESYLQTEFPDFRGGAVYTSHLCAIVKFGVRDKADLIETVKKLRDVEETVRHPAAHEIVSITDEIIKQKTGYDCETIMKLVKKLFCYTEMRLEKSYWDSYDAMNALILEQIG